MVNRVQVTLTLDENHIVMLRDIADKYFEKNISMAARYVMKHHKVQS